MNKRINLDEFTFVEQNLKEPTPPREPNLPLKKIKKEKNICSIYMDISLSELIKILKEKNYKEDYDNIFIAPADDFNRYEPSTQVYTIIKEINPNYDNQMKTYKKEMKHYLKNSQKYKEDLKKYKKDIKDYKKHKDEALASACNILKKLDIADYAQIAQKLPNEHLENALKFFNWLRES
jgi:hypothetical protein